MEIVMKRLILTAIASLFVASVAHAEPRDFRIDPNHFSVGFLIDHVGYASQLGQFLKSEGEFVYDEENHELISGEVRIDASSVFTNHDRRDRHLRSDDFLDADEHETIRFSVTDFVAGEGDGATVIGELTMLGQTHPVELQATVNKAAVYPFGHERHTLGVSARTTITRSQWGMTYGLEGDLVGDEVELIFEFEALLQP